MGFFAAKTNNMTGFTIKEAVTTRGIGFGFLSSLGFLVGSCLLLFKKKKVKNSYKIMFIQSLA